MRNRKKTAFTIVELVIVIAVIGILAAVLIPTFSGVIKNANISNDTQVAAGLTTELRVALPGQEITTEAELMAAIAIIDPDGTKLVPKSLKYGYHFWFEMETQTIILAKAEEIAAKGPSAAPADEDSDADSDGGVVGVSKVVAVADNNADKPSFTGFRDIYGNGYYLIDSDSAFLGDVADIDDAEAYLDFIDAIKSNDNSNYDALAALILDRIENTTIRNQYGVFYFAEPDNKVNGKDVTGNFEYFAPDVKTLSGNKIVYNNKETDPNKMITTYGTSMAVPHAPMDNVVYLPSSVILVQEGALDYAAGTSVTIKSGLKDDAEIALIFAPKSTNATIEDTTGYTYKILENEWYDGSEEKDTANDNGQKDNDVLHTTEGEFKQNLTPRLPYEDFKVSYEDKTEYEGTNATANIEYDEGTNTLYLAAINGTKVQLNAKDLVSGKISYNVLEWKVTSGDKDKLPISSTGQITVNTALYDDADAEYTFTVTAYARNINNAEVSATINVKIVRPKSYNLEINSFKYSVSADTVANESKYQYSDSNTSKLVYNYRGTAFDAGIYGNINFNFATGTEEIIPGDWSNLNITIPEDSIFALDSSNNLTIKEGATIPAAGTEAMFIVDLNGWYETVFSVFVQDYSNPLYLTNFNHESTSDRPYYIGSGNAITLGALFNTVTDDNFLDATVNVYYNKDGAGNRVLIPTTAEGNALYATYTNKIDANNYTNWENQTIQFHGTYTKGTHFVAIEIKHRDGNTSIVEVEIANGAINVTGMSDLISNADENDVVLHGNITSVANSDKIVVGEGKTLYGNGYVINATSYKAEATGGANENLTVYTYNQKYVCSSSSCGANKDVSIANAWWPSYHTKRYGEAHAIKVVAYESTSSGASYTPYETNQALIELNGGTIDNIYINGPVYPKLQYYMDDSYSSSTTNASTPYYVSGVQANNNSTIKNSYISGFRQPVQANGVSGTDTGNTTVTINNTTLRGGNFANLDLVSGNLALHNVTTIQDQNGMKNTVAHGTSGQSGYIAEKSVSVTGIGIAIEEGALTSTKTITGYLNQYNWIKDGQTAELPTISGIQLSTLFDKIFDGVSGIKMSRVLAHYHQSDDGDTYVNTGFVFASMGSTEHLNALPSPVAPNETSRDLVFVDEADEDIKFTTGAFNTKTVDGVTTITRKTEGAALAKIEFRLTSLTGNSTFDLGLADTIAGYFNNADGKVYIWSYKDGRVWDYSDDTVDTTASAKVDVVVLEDGTEHPIHYSGYYDETGDYGSYYADSATPENQISE